MGATSSILRSRDKFRAISRIALSWTSGRTVEARVSIFTGTVPDWIRAIIAAESALNAIPRAPWGQMFCRTSAPRRSASGSSLDMRNNRWA